MRKIWRGDIQIIFISVILLSACNVESEQSVARSGLLDLSAWSFGEQGTLRLDGEWQYYPNHLFSPKDFNNTQPRQYFRWVPAVVLITGLVLMAGYHFILFLLRNRDPSPLYLGFYCLCWAVNNLFSSPSGWLAKAIWPDLSWPVLFQVGISAYFISVPLLVLFLGRLYSEECSRHLNRFFLLSGISFFLSVFVLPIKTIVEMVPVFHGISALFGFYLIYLLVHAVYRQRQAAKVILSGLVILVLSGFNDILHDLDFVNTTYLFHLGVFVFIFFQSLALSMRFSSAFEIVENLSTELMQKNLELARISRLKDEFLTNTAHELRTPLNGIIGINESLMSDSSNVLNTITRNSLSLTCNSARRLANLVNDMLDYSRLVHSDLVLNKQPVDLNSLVSMVVEVMSQLISHKPLRLLNSIPDNLPAVIGDADRLQQILYNLVGNAIRYTEQGQVEIYAKLQGDRVSVCVSDSGKGIAADQLEVIFLPFEHVGNFENQSSGLGLGLSRKLIELHGGELNVVSTPGEGSRFCFDLPGVKAVKSKPTIKRIDRSSEWVKRQIQSEPSLLYTVDRRAASSRLLSHILVVDDDVVNIQLLTNYLTSADMTVTTARSGQEALRHVELGEKFNLVLLDILMPGLNGYEVCRLLRRYFSITELPVVMLTVRDEQKDLVRGLGCGANDYLIKPFSREELLARVRAQLSIQTAHHTLLENQRLNREVEQRQETEHNLRMMQQRLGALLDSVPEMVLAINENAELNFCNQEFEQVTKYRSKDLLGKSPNHLLTEESQQQLRQWLDVMRENGALISEQLDVIYSNHQQHQHFVQPKVLELEEEQLLMLIAYPDSNGETMQNAVAISLVETLNQNRSRLHILEETLNDYIPQLVEKRPEVIDILHGVDSIFTQLSHSLSPNGGDVNKQLSIVNTMNLGVDYWCQNTHSSKSELARKSALWKVYTNEDGWDRTQTMDRYLNIETLPRHPRLKQVKRTANFVLTYCHQHNELRQKLECALAELYQLN